MNIIDQWNNIYSNVKFKQFKINRSKSNYSPELIYDDNIIGVYNTIARAEEVLENVRIGTTKGVKTIDLSIKNKPITFPVQTFNKLFS